MKPVDFAIDGKPFLPRLYWIPREHGFDGWDHERFLFTIRLTPARAYQLSFYASACPIGNFATLDHARIAAELIG